MKTATRVECTEIYVAGQLVHLVGRCVRAPLPLLARIAKGGWAQDSRIVAHQWRCGDKRGWWFEAQFDSRAKAREQFQRLAGHPAAVTGAERARRADSRRLYPRKNEVDGGER